MGMEHPVTGHGTGMTTVLNPLVNRANGVPYNAHNDFVRFFFETGLLGSLCYAIYAIMLCRWVLRRARIIRGRILGNIEPWISDLPNSS